MNNKFNLTPRAKKDLQEVWQYTAEEWDEKQAEKYLASIFERFEWLAEKPEFGRHRTDVQTVSTVIPTDHMLFFIWCDHQKSTLSESLTKSWTY